MGLLSFRTILGGGENHDIMGVPGAKVITVQVLPCGNLPLADFPLALSEQGCTQARASV